MTSHPRLFYLDDIPTPYRLGVFRRIANAWPGQFRIAFCANGEPGREFDLDLSGLDTEVLAGRMWRPIRQVNPFSFKWNPGVVQSIKAYSPDIVVFSGYAHPTMLCAARWCRSFQIPYGIVCETSARNSNVSGWRWHAKRRLAGPMVRGMTFGLPVGKEAASYLRVLGPTQAPMHYFPNTPETTLFVEASERMKVDGSEHIIREQLGLENSAPIILFVGRLIDAKRPLDAIEAFKQLPTVDANLVIVGDGPLRAAATIAAKGDPRIVFTGWISNSKTLAELMAIATAMVLPSQHEPWGAVVNEAMAASTPVIATNRVGAAVELIEHGVDGFIVPVGDIDRISAYMEELIEDPTQSERIGVAAQNNAIRNGAAFAANNLVSGAYEALNREPAQDHAAE